MNLEQVILTIFAGSYIYLGGCDRVKNFLQEIQPKEHSEQAQNSEQTQTNPPQQNRQSQFESALKTKNQKEDKKEDAYQKLLKEDGNIRKTILSYLAQPKFVTPDFMKQVTGVNAKLESYDLGEGMLYFSIPVKQFNDKTLGFLTKKPQGVEFGEIKKKNNNKLVLGDYSFTKPGHYFFRFPSDNFKVDRNRVITRNFGAVNYTLTMKELMNFFLNESIYGGYLMADTGRVGTNGGEVVFVNHGAYVAKKGEPSLTRLVNTIIGKTQKKEEIAQKLLNFTAIDIKSNEEYMEVMKRPNEILMSKNSDCSGHVILYASLLEQTKINYLLVYIKDPKTGSGHIAVAVEGDFENKNGLGFNIDKKSYSIAETATKGFRIGMSNLMGGYTIKDINYIQKPGEDSKLYNVKTGQPLEFR